MRTFEFSDLQDAVGACLGTDNAADLREDSQSTTFVELGFDSLAIYEIVTVLQDRLGLAIPDSDIETMTTPAAVVEYVRARLRAADPDKSTPTR